MCNFILETFIIISGISGILLVALVAGLIGEKFGLEKHRKG
jgi:hypothetical protein